MPSHEELEVTLPFHRRDENLNRIHSVSRDEGLSNLIRVLVQMRHPKRVLKIGVTKCIGGPGDVEGVVSYPALRLGPMNSPAVDADTPNGDNGFLKHVLAVAAVDPVASVDSMLAAGVH